MKNNELAIEKLQGITGAWIIAGNPSFDSIISRLSADNDIFPVVNRLSGNTDTFPIHKVGFDVGPVGRRV